MQHRGKKCYHLTGDWKSHSEGDCELCNKVATLQKVEGDQSEKEIKAIRGGPSNAKGNYWSQRVIKTMDENTPPYIIPLPL